MSLASGLLAGVPDVVLEHRVEGDGRAGSHLFVMAFDPTGIQNANDRKEGMAYWGRENQVALLVMRYDERKKMHARDVRILDSYQRQKLAARMYRYAQEVSGRTAKPSHDRTDAGQAMWKSFKREGTLKRHW